MFNKPINNILKSHFDTILSYSIERAEKDFKNKISDEILDLEHFEKLQFCLLEKERINKLIEESKYPYYIKNHSSEDWLLSQFSSRHFLLNVDETEELKSSIYIGKYDNLLSNEIYDLKKRIPKYTFKEFIDGKKCKYLNSFDYHYNIDKEDYYKIITWQSDSLIKIVSYEVELLVKKHQEYCSTIDNPLVFINEQILILEEELTKSIDNAKELKSILSKLFAFKDVDITNYDDKLLLFNYPSFFNDRIEFKRLNPSTVNKILEKLSSKPNILFSNEYMIFYTLDVFLSWLKDIIKGKSIQELFKYPVWEDLLNQTIKTADQEVQPIIEKINDYAYNPANSKKDIRTYLSNEFEKQISKYNDIENKQIFYLLRDENKNTLISDFKINALFNNGKEEYLKSIKEAYILQNVSWDISFTFQEIFDTRTIYFKGDTGSYISINFLMHKMILDKDIYNELNEAMDDFFKHLHNHSLPMDIHFYNHRKKYSKLFEKSISRLQDVLDNAEPNKKVLYIQSRLKELRQRELKFRALIERRKNLKGKEDKYPNLFKEFLSIEADFIKETVQVSPITFLPNSKKRLLIDVKTNNFKTFVSLEKQDYILKLIEDLSITKDGIYNLGLRSKGTIRGVVEALREEHIIPKFSLEKLCNIIAEQIDLELKSKLDWSTTSDNYHKKALQYIKQHPLH